VIIQLITLAADAAAGSEDGSLTWARLITTGGAVTVMAWALHSLLSGKLRHEREVNQANEVWKERLQNERDEREKDADIAAAHLSELRSNLKDTSQQLDRALHLLGQSRPIVQTALSIAEKSTPVVGSEPKGQTP
jgi:hypothetical protein